MPLQVPPPCLSRHSAAVEARALAICHTESRTARITSPRAAPRRSVRPRPTAHAPPPTATRVVDVVRVLLFCRLPLGGRRLGQEASCTVQCSRNWYTEIPTVTRSIRGETAGCARHGLVPHTTYTGTHRSLIRNHSDCAEPESQSGHSMALGILHKALCLRAARSSASRPGARWRVLMPMANSRTEPAHIQPLLTPT